MSRANRGAPRAQGTTFTAAVSGTFAFQMLALAMGILNTVLIARTLGETGLGLVALALLIPAMIELFFGCGIGISNLYFVASRRFTTAELGRNSAGVALLAAGTGAVVATLVAASGIGARLFPGVTPGLFLLALLCAPFMLLNGYFAALLQGLQRPTQAAAVGALQAFINVSCTFLLMVVLDMGIAGVLFAAIAASAVAVVILIVLLGQPLSAMLPQLEPRVLRPTAAFALRGHAANVLQFLNYRLDLVILSAFVGPAAVGVYSVAGRLAELLWHLPNAIGIVLFPKSASGAADAKLVARLFRSTGALLAAGAVVIAIIGRDFIELAFGPAFSTAFVPLLILLPGVVSVGLAKVLTNDIAGRGFPIYNSVNAGLALIVTIGLDLLLIPRYGIAGAAAASSIAYAVVLILALYFHRCVSTRVVDVVEAPLVPTPVSP